jgi:signal transduction histidine kinase
MSNHQKPSPSESPPTSAPLADPEHVVEMAELVAHEVNNLLNNILLHVAVIDRKGLDAARAELAVIRQAGTRAGHIINRWQQMAPRRSAELQPVDLNRLVAGVIAAWKASPAGERFPPVSFDPAAELAPVLANAADLERLVQLLLLNAAAPSQGGTITVRTQAAPAEVLLLVLDTGTSLDPTLIDRLFEPFFVARSSGGAETDPHTELGLALCKRLVRRQQGTIHAENRPEGGVRVVVHLRQASNP